MREQEFLSPIEPSSEMVFLFHGVCFAYTPKQRQWIIDANGGEPQLRHYSEEKGLYNAREDYCQTPQEPCDHIEVHHIKNQADGGEDIPSNGIPLGKCQHVGICPSGKIKASIARRR